MKKEWLARILVVILLAAAVGIPAAAAWQRDQGSVIHAKMAETGGWTPENLTAVVGEPLHLRLTSDDVIHSFAVGQASTLPGSPRPVDVIPGEVTEVTLLFDKPGKYTFYCTRWCSVNHWRMRGVIEVTDPEAGTSAIPAAVESPLYVTLGLDIDADRQASGLPRQVPSVVRGALLEQAVPYQYLGREYYQTHSPSELWQALRSEPSLQGLSDQDIWDMAARVWLANTTPQEIAEGKQLYADNCAACHGETGAGDGVFAGELAQPEGDHTGMAAGTMTTRPADFTDPNRMLSASPALLQGKILRGGMGTGMPYWGPIFTDEQTWALVAYLWTFQFEMENRP